MRWFLVIPLAVAGLAIAQLVIIIVTAFVPWGFVSREVSALVTPAAFVILGARAAPAYKVHTAGVLAVLMLFAHGVFWGFVLAGNVTASLGESTLAALLGLIGTICGLFFVYRQQRRDMVGYLE